MVEAMRTDFLRWTATMDLPVAGYVEMVANVAEATVADVFATTILKAQAHALRRGRAMNNEEGNRTHGYLQAPKPKAPTMAVATVMITLRTMPHTFFDFFSSFIIIDDL